MRKWMWRLYLPSEHKYGSKGIVMYNVIHMYKLLHFAKAANNQKELNKHLIQLHAAGRCAWNPFSPKMMIMLCICWMCKFKKKSI